MAEPMQEPEDGRLAIVGEPGSGWRVVLERHDENARVAVGLGAAQPFARWFDVTGVEGEPLSWGQVTGQEDDRGWLPEYINRAVVEELVPRTDVELMIEKARQLAGLRHYGDHVIEPAGWCRHCDVHHAETEIARLAEEYGAAERDGMQPERAILRWAAERLEAEPACERTAEQERATVVADLRRWADELDAKDGGGSGG